MGSVTASHGGSQSCRVSTRKDSAHTHTHTRSEDTGRLFAWPRLPYFPSRTHFTVKIGPTNAPNPANWIIRIELGVASVNVGVWLADKHGELQQDCLACAMCSPASNVHANSTFCYSHHEKRCCTTRTFYDAAEAFCLHPVLLLQEQAAANVTLHSGIN